MPDVKVLAQSWADWHYKHAVSDPAKSATYVPSLLAGHGVLAVIEPPAPTRPGVI